MAETIKQEVNQEAMNNHFQALEAQINANSQHIEEIVASLNSLKEKYDASSGTYSGRKTGEEHQQHKGHQAMEFEEQNEVEHSKKKGYNIFKRWW